MWVTGGSFLFPKLYHFTLLALLHFDNLIIDLRQLLSLRRRLKKNEHSLRMRIRNGLLALYFPELDSYYGSCESETLAIVRWCLDPDKIAMMDHGQFFKLVTRIRRGVAQKLRLNKIHQAAIDSVGCPMGPAGEFEAELLVDSLDYLGYTVEFIWIMSKFSASTRENIEQLIWTPTMRALLSAHQSRVKELVESFEESQDVEL